MTSRTVTGGLAGAALVAALAGCGADEPDRRAEQAPSSQEPSPSSPSSQGPSEPPAAGATVPYREVALLSASDAGGRVSGTPVRVDDPDRLETWLSRLEAQTLRDDVRRAVAEAETRTGEALLAAVLSVGCERPAGWSLVADGDGGLEVSARMPKERVQCLVPVTTVAVLAVPETALS